jgi:DNA-binding Lrp family transcriptional regulator
MADIGRTRPITAEMPPLDQDIGGRHDPFVGGGHHRGIVPRPEQGGLPGLESRDDPGDEPELSRLGNAHVRPTFRLFASRCRTDSYGSFTFRVTADVDWSRIVVQAYILIQTEVGKAHDVAASIGKIPGVVRVDAVTGPYDVVVLAEAHTVDDLGSLIVSKVQYVQGIMRTLTCSVVNL